MLASTVLAIEKKKKILADVFVGIINVLFVVRIYTKHFWLRRYGRASA
jgi:hypothetical protein